MLAEFADDGKLCIALETLENRAVIQKDLDKLQEWSDRSFLKFSKGKCFILLLEQSNPLKQHNLGTDGLSGSLAEKNLVLMHSKDKASQQHMVVKGNYFIGKIVESLVCLAGRRGRATWSLPLTEMRL